MHTRSPGSACSWISCERGWMTLVLALKGQGAAGSCHRLKVRQFVGRVNPVKGAGRVCV